MYLYLVLFINNLKKHDYSSLHRKLEEPEGICKEKHNKFQKSLSDTAIIPEECYKE